MLKIARAVGVALMLSFLLAACNPTNFFLTQAYNDQETPTPRSLTTAQVASLIQNQLESQGIAAQVSGTENNLVVNYPAGSAEENFIIGRILSSVGGYLELNYTNITAVTLVPVTNGQPGESMVVSAEDVESWYQRELTDAEMLTMLTSPDAGTQVMTATDTITGTDVMTGTQ